MPDGFAPFSTQFNQQNLLQALLNPNAQPQNGQQAVDSHMQAAISQEQEAARQQQEQQAAAQVLAELAAPSGAQAASFLSGNVQPQEATAVQPSQTQQDAQAQQAAQEAVGLLGASQPTEASTPQPARQDIAQGLLGAYAADTPTQRAFDAQLYDQYVRPQMNAALQPYRDAQYAANEAAIRRANPETVMGEKRQIVNGLAQAKAQYDAAKAAGNEQGMALAHQAAEMLRQQAQSIGLDLGAYGGDADTQTMAQALANNDARAMASVIDNDMTPEQYYQQLYNQARNSGMGRKESEGYAQAHTERYQAERNARMQSAFYTYGLNGNSITPYGMQILTKWAAGEDPQAFLGIVSKTFGLPIDEYKLGAQRTLAGDQHKYDVENIGVKHQANMQEIGLKGKIQAQITQLNGQIKAALAQQQFGYAQELQRQKLAAQAYLKSLGGGGGSSSSSKSGDGKPLSEAMQKKLLNARDLYENEKGSLSNVQETIDALDKIKGELSDDDARDAINAMEYALNARREAVSWNDHGESGGKQNFIDYYDAVANAGYPELVSDLSALYDRAKNG